jgi:hypothetical protein
MWCNVSYLWESSFSRIIYFFQFENTRIKLSQTLPGFSVSRWLMYVYSMNSIFFCGYIMLLVFDHLSLIPFYLSCTLVLIKSTGFHPANHSVVSYNSYGTRMKSMHVLKILQDQKDRGVGFPAQTISYCITALTAWCSLLLVSLIHILIGRILCTLDTT